MASANAAMSPLRFATPGQLIICLILFFLPWIEIQCPMPDLKSEMKMSMPEPGKKATPPAPPDFSKMNYVPLLSQSGLQAATGGYTIAIAQGLGDMGDLKGKKDGKDPKEDVPAAPLLFLYVLACIGGIAVGFAMKGGNTRKMALIACSSLALLTAGGQAVIGFPVAKKIKESPMGPPGGGGMMGPGLGGKDGPKINPDDMFKTVYQFPFYLALLFSLGGIVTAAITPNGPAKKKPLYDLDDEDNRDDEDEEDDRPRKRRRSRDDDDDEDEEPRQRKTRRDDDEEDEPKPRRKSRNDDDEEDEPKPRRRREEAEEDEPKPRRREEKPPEKGDKGDRGGRSGKRPPPENPFA
ncbi:MAG: hypothetical protein K8U57_06610 [Planctomycetes bacterium]|nr:hypothetical protein [Planctomycetota bacterium]